MEKLKTEFEGRAAMEDYIQSLVETSDSSALCTKIGSRAAAEDTLAKLDVSDYARSRNYLDGAVTELSPYIRHGVISPNTVRNAALEQGDGAEKFVQQLAWRDYWQRRYHASPDEIWHNIEPYKTGFTDADYADDLPDDIAMGETGVAFIDACIARLLQEGLMHNHARLYVAAYVVHWRRVKWQAGARWFLRHLLDGDPASNNLSWQWVASTFSHKPYYFNLDNVQKFSGAGYDVSPTNNAPLVGSYEDLADQLFPHMETRS